MKKRQQEIKQLNLLFMNLMLRTLIMIKIAQIPIESGILINLLERFS